MYFSDGCFSDQELKNFCLSSPLIGNCSFTNKHDVPVIEFKELLNFFSDVLDLFTEDKSSSRTTIDIIQQDWNLFSSNECGIRILNEISKKNPIALSSTTKASYKEKYVVVQESWSELNEEIFWSNRFLVNTQNLIEEHFWESFY